MRSKDITNRDQRTVNSRGPCWDEWVLTVKGACLTPLKFQDRAGRLDTSHQDSVHCVCGRLKGYQSQWLHRMKKGQIDADPPATTDVHYICSVSTPFNRLTTFYSTLTAF